MHKCSTQIGLIHRQLSHIWFTYEYHMRIICFVSYENHKKRASNANHMWQIIWLTYDINMWIICEQLHMNMKIIRRGHHMVIIWIIFAYCIYALLFFEKQVTWFTVNFKTFNLSKVLLNGKYASLIFYKCSSPNK